MKKFLSFTVLAVGVLALTAGCGSSEEKKMVCTLSKNDTVNNYSLKSTYNVYHKNNIVNKVEITEEISSDDEVVLKNFKDSLDNNYKTLNDTFGGYKYTVENKNGKVMSNVTVDYQTLDLEKLKEQDPSIKNGLTKDNKMRLDAIKNTYTIIGATCK